MTIFEENFSGRTILITGHTGFKGSWLTCWLLSLGAKVVGVSLHETSNPSHFEVAKMASKIIDYRIDIRNYSALEKAILDTQPDFIFHLAAQALVRLSYENPIETWQTNVIGTLNILEALRKLNKICSVVLITSDKCYENSEWVWGYRETDVLGGVDPYSGSKGAAELAIKSHIGSFFPGETSLARIGVARAGNVIGGGDWADNRIIPDCVKAWSSNNVVELRNPNSTRPWQHVLEPLSGYLTLAIALSKSPKLHGEVFNFGPKAQQNHSVLQLVECMSKHWDQVRWSIAISGGTEPYEAGLLKLNCDKALHYLNWQAVLGFEDTVKLTSEWYKSFYKGNANILECTQNQIDFYINSHCCPNVLDESKYNRLITNK